MTRKSTLLLFVFILTIVSHLVIAANDPGHDALYIEQTGSSELSGSLNITEELKVANLFYSSYLDILGNGSQPSGSYAQIYTPSAGNNLILNAPQSIYLAKDGGSTVYIGGTNVNLNVSGSAYVTGGLYQGGVAVCLSNGTNCVNGNNTGNVSSVTAGSGLTDSGTASDPVLNVGAGLGITVNADDVAIDPTYTQRRVSGTCSAGEAIQTINEDGTVTCQSTSGASTAGGWTNTSTTTSTSLNVNVNSGKFFVNSTNGFVGIGTITPTAKLHVYGDSSDGPVFKLRDAKQGYEREWQIGPEDSLFTIKDVTAANAVRVAINSEGRVGIGTTSPSRQLHINSDTSDASMTITSGSGDTFMNFGPTSDYDEAGFIYRPSTHTLGIRTNGVSDRVVVDGNGNLGVGTTSPGTELDVNGTINASTDICITGGLCLSEAGTGSGDITAVNAGTGLTGGGTSGDVTLNVNTTWLDANYIGQNEYPNLDTDSTDDLTTSTSWSGDLTGTGSSPTIAANAVALGTDTTGNYVSSVSGGNGISVSGSAGEGWTPSVAIDTTDISTCTAAGQKILWDSSNNRLTCGTDQDSGGTIGGSGAANKLAFWTASDTLGYDGYLTWNNTAGYLGIGTTSPASPLAVIKSLNPMNSPIFAIDTQLSSSSSGNANTYVGAIRGILLTSGSSGGNSNRNAGLWGSVKHTSGGNYGTLAGVLSWSYTEGTTGNVTALDLFNGNYWQNAGTGTVTDARGLYIAPYSSTGGQTTNVYGVYISSQTAGANNYAIYTAGSTPSYFGGNVTVAGAITASGSTVCTAANGLCNQTDTTLSEAQVEGFVYDNDNTLSGPWTVAASGTNDINFDSNTFVVDVSENRVGVGTATPSKRLAVSDGSKAITLDPDASVPTINTTGGNLTISSASGYVIISIG